MVVPVGPTGITDSDPVRLFTIEEFLKTRSPPLANRYPYDMSMPDIATASSTSDPLLSNMGCSICAQESGTSHMPQLFVPDTGGMVAGVGPRLKLRSISLAPVATDIAATSGAV